MATILSIETSTEICSVCVSKSKSSNIVFSAEKVFAHASKITLLIQSALEKAQIKMKDLDAIALSAGPGSYTGLRVGSSTAKGICFALDKPLIVVDTLESIALASQKANPGYDYYCPMIDARRMEVYTALFDSNAKRMEQDKPLIITADSFKEFLSKGKRILFSGNGAPKIFDVVVSENATLSSVQCSAEHLTSLAEQAYENKRFADIAYFSPSYLKAPNITKSKKVL